MMVPVFGAMANFGCMAFYIIGPMEGLGSARSRLLQWNAVGIWGTYGAYYFSRNSKKLGRDTLTAKVTTA